MDITYQLFIEVEAPVTVVVGRLGCFEFCTGSYVYTGSARRNMDARIARHLRADKKLRWHIDYLLALEVVRVSGVERFSREECAVNKDVSGEIVVNGFGASDCRAACGSHLKLLSR